MTQPAHHWLFVLALLCRLFAGQPAMADMSPMQAAAGAQGTMHHPAVDTAGSATAPVAHAGHDLQHAAGSDASTPAAAHHSDDCAAHECCPGGACECACVNLSLVMPATVPAPVTARVCQQRMRWVSPAPELRPERVFRPPA